MWITIVFIHAEMGICTSQQDPLKQQLYIYNYIEFRDKNGR